MLLVVGDIEVKLTASGRKLRQVPCKCDCGLVKLFYLDHLKSGHTTSCGCNKANKLKVANTTHGKTNTRTYRAFCNMLKRCFCETSDNYSHYGGRGITVCDRWLPSAGGSFTNFLADMGECPEGLTLDRTDVNGDYEPPNCEWRDLSDQAFNRTPSQNTSGKVGVSFNKKLRRYIAFISKSGKRIHLGCFENFEDAVKSRQDAELKYFGRTL